MLRIARRSISIALTLALATPILAAPDDAPGAAPIRARSAIFLHPDGAGLAHWGLARVHWVGPDGRLAWDALPAIATYRPHVTDSLAPQSHSGATIHAFGVKVVQDSFGMDGTKPIASASGAPHGIMREALAGGRAVGIVNSGHLAEPGTACFLANVPKRSMMTEVARQLLVDRPNVILGGGEALFLPKGVQGRHGVGVREDGRDLLDEAAKAGYVVVRTREELAAVPEGTTHLLGVFAPMSTYNDAPEETLAARGIPHYRADAPNYAEMIRAALKVLARDPDGFLLVAEEEGSDNFSNHHNASGLLEAMRRADEGVAAAEIFRAAHPDTLVLLASDSCAASPQMVALPESAGIIVTGRALPATLPGDPAALDGVRGARSEPFLSAPARDGTRLPFAVAWGSLEDGGDPVLVRAAGPGSELVRGDLDNTDIYRVLYTALFGRTPEDAR
ncbi:MAG: alkaline phosphatase, partial [Planctomycetota bacterium]